MVTEEAVKTSIVLPFLSALGYDVFDPGEVVPEFTADAVGKKGEKVDYAIKMGGSIRILIECKPITTTLDKHHLAQLYRYFSVTDAKFAILTNGRTFQFHTDLEAPNRLDDRPFLTFDLAEINSSLLPEIKKFGKDDFDVDGVLQSANRLKYTSLLKRKITELMEEPTDDFVRLIMADIYDGRFTASVKEQYAPMVKGAFRELIRDLVQARISTALASTNAVDVEPMTEAEPVSEDEIVTTDEEKEGFMIVRAIAREVIATNRVVMRDQKTYCGILIDNNNRKPLARLWFNRSVKYLGLFDGEKEERVRIDSLDHIYDFTDRIRATARRYVDDAGSEQN
ncbi:restriction endonuclease [Fulvimarina endophytica]|uniref:Restriction endonuclease n=2 Tax=Fulvimarina endophytica TaxID=2293836 RepID=A0A371X4P2_9HYPH|nr:type I restriction endonuclease [Fulvimarina endophytica]RFC64202.1 restriction endonuclease [Fulvimarina endophytica]